MSRKRDRRHRRDRPLDELRVSNGVESLSGPTDVRRDPDVRRPHRRGTTVHADQGL